MKPDRSTWLLAALLFIHLLVFLCSLIRPPASLSDSQDYLNASRNLYKQGILYCGDLSTTIREEQFTRRPPLYPVLLGLSVASGSIIPVCFFQIALSLLAVILVIRIFNSSLKQTGFEASLLIMLLFTPAQFIYSSRVMAEIPFQLLLVLSAWSVFRYFKDREVRYIWLFNLFITLGMATKPVLFPFAILMSFFSLFLFFRYRRTAFLLSLCIPVTWISLYSVWNYQRVGSTQYASIQTANLVNYNLRYFIMSRQGPDIASDAVDQLYADCGPEPDYREKNRCLERGAREVLLREPFRYILFHARGMIRFFLDPGRFDLVTFFNLQGPDSPGFLKALNKEGIRGAFSFLKTQRWGLVVTLGLITLFKIIKLTGFLFYVFRRGTNLPIRIYLMLLVVYLALATGPLGASRFLLPAELLVIGGAAAGWLALLKIQQPIEF